jgi:hypothetical protein
MQCVHASVHMFIEFVCVRVFKGKTKNVPNLYSLDGPLFMYPLPWDKKNVHVSTKIDFILCCMPSRRPSCGKTAALMKRKEEVCKHSTCLCLLQLKHGDIPVGVAKISHIGKHVAVRLASL